MADNVIRLVIPARKEYVSLARLAVGGLARQLAFDEETVEDIKIAMSEACTNIVLGATNELPTLDLRLSFSDDKLTVDIDSAGAEIELGSLTPIVWADRREPGFGMSIVSMLMDNVELVSNSGRQILRLTKYVQAE